MFSLHSSLLKHFFQCDYNHRKSFGGGASTCGTISRTNGWISRTGEMISGKLPATGGLIDCDDFANLGYRKVKIRTAHVKAVTLIHYSKPGQPISWQGSALARLASGIAISLAVHISLGLWFARPVEQSTTPATLPRLKIHLVGKQPTIVQKPVTRTLMRDARPLTEPTMPLSAAETPAWTPSPMATDETYLAPENVEKMAYVIDVEELPLPENTNMRGGMAYLKVQINESGSADKIDILTSTLPEAYVQTLVGSFYQARFSPASLAGAPVKSWRIIEIRFDLPDPTAG